MSLGSVRADLLRRGWEAYCQRAALIGDSGDAKRFGSFGDGSIMSFPQGALFGQQAIHIGRDTLIGPNVSLSVGMGPGQELVSDRMLIIGDRCLIGRGSSIVAHLDIEIADDVFFGPNVYITDQNHDFSDPNQPIGKQSMPEKPVKVGEGSWLATGVVVLPGVTIGHHVAVGANSVVTKDLPANSVAVGSPARVIRRID